MPITRWPNNRDILPEVSRSASGRIGFSWWYHFSMVITPPNSIHPKTRAEWRKWLKQNHSRTEGVWLINLKKPLV